MHITQLSKLTASSFIFFISSHTKSTLIIITGFLAISLYFWFLIKLPMLQKCTNTIAGIPWYYRHAPYWDAANTKSSHIPPTNNAFMSTNISLCARALFDQEQRTRYWLSCFRECFIHTSPLHYAMPSHRRKLVLTNDLFHFSMRWKAVYIS